MITAKQWESFTPNHRKELIAKRVYIPDNGYGIKVGYYTDAEIAQAIRWYREFGTRGQVKFLVDML